MGRLRRRRGQRGFTLLELLVVLVMLAVIVAVTAPATGRFLDRLEARKKERRLMAVLRYARLQAIAGGETVTVRVGEDGRVLELAGGVEERRNVGLGEDERLQLEPEPMYFYPEGTATPGELILAGDYRSLTIDIDPLTGLPVRRLTEAGE